MNHIEKAHYHDEVFRECATYIREIENGGEQIEGLRLALSHASELTRDVEREFLLAWNDKNESQIIFTTGRFVSSLMSFFVQYNPGYFSSTFDYVERILDSYNFEDVIRYSTFERFSNIYFAIRAPRERRIKELTGKRCFIIFFKLIKCIVRDINDADGWDIVSQYYFSRYLKYAVEDEKVIFSRIKNHDEITFLSYAFKDSAYALYLFHQFDSLGYFLYVDCLFNHAINDGKEIKETIAPWIKHSKNFLFLRTTISDSNGVRPWCSWEMGRAYSVCLYFYCVDVVDTKNNKNLMLSDFEFTDDIQRIVGYDV